MVDAIVERHLSVDDGMGGSDFVWSDFIEISGVLDQLSGDEILASDKVGELSTHIFIIFNIVGVVRGDRFIINNNIYNVTNVDNPNNMNRQLEIKLKYVGDKDEV